MVKIIIKDGIAVREEEVSLEFSKLIEKMLDNYRDTPSEAEIDGRRLYLKRRK